MTLNTKNMLLTEAERSDCVKSQDTMLWDICEAQNRKTLGKVAEWLESDEVFDLINGLNTKVYSVDVGRKLSLNVKRVLS